MRSARAIIAPSGMPDAMPLAVATMSGWTPQCSIAHILPVRPAPDWTSSATSRMPLSIADAAQAREEVVVGYDVAALALDRLDDDRGDLVGRDEAFEHAVLELVETGAAERHVVDAGEHRPEAGVVLRL